MKTISIPTHNRPAHLTRCLEALKAAKGIEDWTVVFSCEPDTDTISTASRYPHGFYLSRNPFNLGIWHNTFHAATLAMALKPTVNLYVEDDYLISSDALAMIDQWATSGHDGVICLRRWHESQIAIAPDRVAPAPHGLLGCGFAWRAGMWPTVREAWFSTDEHGQRPMWDICAAAYLNAKGIRQFRPMVSRSKGIGTHGTHSRSGADQNLFGPAYEGDPVKNFTFYP